MDLAQYLVMHVVRVSLKISIAAANIQNTVPRQDEGGRPFVSRLNRRVAESVVELSIEFCRTGLQGGKVKVFFHIVYEIDMADFKFVCRIYIVVMTKKPDDVARSDLFH